MPSQSGWSSFVAYSCVHFPNVHRESERRLFDWIADNRPDVVVMLGDLFDGSAASRWPNEDDWGLHEEYCQAARHLETVRSLCPGSRHVWLLGNHEQNTLDPNRIPKRLRGLTDFRLGHTPLGDEARHWKILPYSHRQVYRLGPVSFQHGAEHGSRSGLRLAQLYAPENGLLVYGHTHRPVAPVQPDISPGVPLRKWYANAGCMCDWDKMQYTYRLNTATWGHGMVVGVANDAQRRTTFATKQWDAETVVWEYAHQ